MATNSNNQQDYYITTTSSDGSDEEQFENEETEDEYLRFRDQSMEIQDPTPSTSTSPTKPDLQSPRNRGQKGKRINNSGTPKKKRQRKDIRSRSPAESVSEKKISLSL